MDADDLAGMNERELRDRLHDAETTLANCQGTLRQSKQAEMEWEQTARMLEKQNGEMRNELLVTRTDVSLLIRTLNTLTEKVGLNVSED